MLDDALKIRYIKML